MGFAVVSKCLLYTSSLNWGGNVCMKTILSQRDSLCVNEENRELYSALEGRGEGEKVPGPTSTIHFNFFNIPNFVTFATIYLQ